MPQNYIKCMITLKDKFKTDVSTNQMKIRLERLNGAKNMHFRKKKVFNHVLIRIFFITYINANLHVHGKNMFRQIIKKCLENSEKTSRDSEKKRSVPGVAVKIKSP